MTRTTKQTEEMDKILADRLQVSFNEEEVSLLERAVDLMSGSLANSIDRADGRIKMLLSRREEIESMKSKKINYQEIIGNGIKDWDECMTYFHVYRDISDRLKKLRWKHKILKEAKE